MSKTMSQKQFITILPKYILLKIIIISNSEQDRLHFMRTCRKIYDLLPLYVDYLKQNYSIVEIYSQCRFIAIKEFIPLYAHHICASGNEWAIKKMINEVRDERYQMDIFCELVKNSTIKLRQYFLDTFVDNGEIEIFLKHDFKFACAGGNIEILKIASIRNGDVRGGINYACFYGHIHVIKYMMENESLSGNLQNYINNTDSFHTILITILSGNRELIELIISKSTYILTPEDKIICAAITALINKDAKKFSKLINRDPTLLTKNANFRILLCYAEGFNRICETGNVELIKEFMAILSFVEDKQKLMFNGMIGAVKSKNIEAVKLICESYNQTWCFARFYENANYKIMKYFITFNEKCKFLQEDKHSLKKLTEFYGLKYPELEKIQKSLKNPPKNPPKFKLVRRRHRDNK